MNPTRDIALKLTVPQLVAKYRSGCSKIVDALALLTEGEDELSSVFNDGGKGTFNHLRVAHFLKHHYGDTGNPETIIPLIRQHIWRQLIDRMEIRKVCSMKRVQEIDEQLKDAKNLPEITEATVMAMLETELNNIGETLKGLVKEVFDALRPSPDGYLVKDLKTHAANMYEIQERLVIGWAVERGYGGTWRVKYSGSTSHYSAETKIRCLSNVMCMLDGQPLPSTHYGPLYDAINALPKELNSGECEYFEFRCFKNGNLHLRFKRLDLLAELNRVGSGGEPRLKGPNPNPRKGTQA